MTLTFEHVTWKSKESSTHWGQPLHQVIDLVKWSKDIERTTQWFDLDLWTCDLKINRDHLLIQGNPCTKFGIDQMKGSKDIERTTLGLQINIPTDRHTDRPTDSCKTICHLFQVSNLNFVHCLLSVYSSMFRFFYQKKCLILKIDYLSSYNLSFRVGEWC